MSAFGSTEFPTTMKLDAEEYGRKLAECAIANNFDGVDLDYEDNRAMEQGTAEEWLIRCTQTVRKVLQKGQYILTHSPQASYFTNSRKIYPSGGYLRVHKAVGELIDWYNIQFYNQGSTRYDTYQTLFAESKGYFPGTSVGEIIKAGVPREMIVIAKPAQQSDAVNTGWVGFSDFGTYCRQAGAELGWNTGIAVWQFSSDLKGTYLSQFSAAYRPKADK